MTKKRDNDLKSRRYKKKTNDRKRSKGVKEQRQKDREWLTLSVTNINNDDDDDNDSYIDYRDYRDYRDYNEMQWYDKYDDRSTCTLCRNGPFVKVVESYRSKLSTKDELERILSACISFRFCKIIPHKHTFDIVACQYENFFTERYEVLGLPNHWKNDVMEYVRVL